MKKTTVYLPDELKKELLRTAAETGQSEAELIRFGIQLAVERHRPPTPRAPLFRSGDPHLAEKVDEYMQGFGED